ncbi:MAG: ABC transporter substrate-binding protein [Chloroherpetonaceae bacterium]|nr:ABC transporter substrate-binding protein [Chloroherpetonaceae bacterium]MDW8437719.1 ABC transporter substrate-binding protein [Chloroherpetonaceae bacterium]
MRHFRPLLLLVALPFFLGCESKPSLPKIGYAQMFLDPTLDKAKQGFYDALKAGGFENGKNVEIIERNAQGDNATLNQSIEYFIAQKVALIATNPTVATIAAVQRTKDIPICMMVSPRPDLAGLTDSNGNPPPNLSGAFETLDYIDASVALIKQAFPNAKRVGTIYNSSEPNAVNALGRLRKMCQTLGLELVEAGAVSSNETQQVAMSLLSRGIDVFFALPDNVIFASFETIYQTFMPKKIPIVSSEAGLVERGALMAYGADFYEWGKLAGEQAVRILKGEKHVPPVEIAVRKRVYNEKTARELGLSVPNAFEKI